MAKISKVSATCIRNMTIAVWQQRVTAEDAFYKIYENEQGMTDEIAAEIMEVLGYAASRKSSIDDAVEDIVDLIEG